MDLHIATIDIALQITTQRYTELLGSDHYPIQIKIGGPVRTEDYTTDKFNYKKANWQAFKDSIKANLDNLDHITPVNSVTLQREYSNYIDMIHKAMYVSIPQIKSTTNKTKRVPYWNEKCQTAVQNRKKALMKFESTRTEADLIEYKKLKALAQKTIRFEQKSYWENYCGSLTSNTSLSSVWRMSKRMTGNNTTRRIPTIIQENNQFITNKEKAKHYANVSKTTNYEKSFLKHKTFMESIWNTPKFTPKPETDTLNIPLQYDELQAAITQIKKDTSPGEDKITYEIIKHLPKIAKTFLLNLLNSLYLNNLFIQEWKSSIIIPILKNGENPSLPASYRPISLTSCICKILERIITNRLLWYLEKSKILNNYQTAFRKQKSTVDHILRLFNSANRTINNKGYTLVTFLDFSKAFDMIWIEGLLFKLRQMNITGNLYHFIKNFLTNRQIKVKIGNDLSHEYTLENGTPQGSVISPLLFIIMLNDFPTIKDADVDTSLYADDSAVWKNGRNINLLYKHMQSALDNITKYTEAWGIKINRKKTVHMLITHKRATYTSNLYIHKQRIERVNSYKFLGLYFDTHLNWKEHVDYLDIKCKRIINLLKNLTGRHWGASKRSLLQIYKSLIRSKLDYGSEVFYTASKKALAKLDSIQHRCLRISCQAPKFTSLTALQNECGELPLKLHHLKNLYRHIIRIKSNETNPASTTLDYTWEDYYGSFKKGHEPISIKIKEILPLLKQHIDFPAQTDFPYWKYHPPNVDLELATCGITKSENPMELLQLANTKIAHYEHLLDIYTDASQDNNSTSCAFVIPKLHQDYKTRLDKNVTILEAELIAIDKAIQYALQISCLQQCNKGIVIFSDSLSALKILQNSYGKFLSETTRNIIYNTQLITQKINTLTHVWIPSHISIKGNDKADLLAKQALAYTNVEITPVFFNQNYLYQQIDKVIIEHWQEDYNKTQQAHFYKLHQPTVNRDIKFTHPIRQIETAITRIRLGVAFVNKTLHKIKKHPTGLCDTCNKTEDLEHFLLHCPKYKTFTTSPHTNIESIITDKRALLDIYKKAKNNNKFL